VDGAPVASARPAPLFDQHSDEILSEWTGASVERIAMLRSSGVLGGRPSS
jgi:hypothetical protein